MVAHAEIPAVEHNAVTGFEVDAAGVQHYTSQVDARNQWERPDHWARAGEGQRVLVVQRGILDLHQHVAIHQVGLVEIDQLRGNAGVGLAGQQCLETHGAVSRSVDEPMLGSHHYRNKNDDFP